VEVRAPRAVLHDEPVDVERLKPLSGTLLEYLGG